MASPRSAVPVRGKCPTPAWAATAVLGTVHIGTSEASRCPLRREVCRAGHRRDPAAHAGAGADAAHRLGRDRPPPLLGARQRAGRPDALPRGRGAAADHGAGAPGRRRRDPGVRAPAGRRGRRRARVGHRAEHPAGAGRPRRRGGRPWTGRARGAAADPVHRAVADGRQRAGRGGVRGGGPDVGGPAGAHPCRRRGRRPGHRPGPAGQAPRRLGPADRRGRNAPAGRPAGRAAVGPADLATAVDRLRGARPPASAALTQPDETVLLQSLGNGRAHPRIPRRRATRAVPAGRPARRQRRRAAADAAPRAVPRPRQRHGRAAHRAPPAAAGRRGGRGRRRSSPRWATASRTPRSGPSPSSAAPSSGAAAVDVAADAAAHARRADVLGRAGRRRSSSSSVPTPTSRPAGAAARAGSGRHRRDRAAGGVERSWPRVSGTPGRRPSTAGPPGDR